MSNDFDRESGALDLLWHLYNEGELSMTAEQIDSMAPGRAYEILRAAGYSYDWHYGEWSKEDGDE